jgi:hypothetical protein
VTTQENETMPDEPASPADYDLARIAAAADARDDVYLLDLVELAGRGLSTSVGLLVNGVFITGILTSAKDIAEETDVARAWLADQSRRHTDPKELATDELENNLKDFSTAASRAFADFQEVFTKAHEEAEPYLDDDGFAFEKAPAQISRRLIQTSQRAFITLKDAQIVAPGQPGSAKLPVLRVALAHIAAWWVIQLDAEGRASFQLFRVDQGQ